MDQQTMNLKLTIPEEESNNQLSNLKTGISFDPAQHWENTVQTLNNSEDFNTAPAFNSDFNTSIQEGQITAPVSSYSNTDETFKSTGDNFTNPPQPEINSFNNPASMFSFSPENAFSSAGELPSMEPASAFTPAEAPDNF